MRWALTSSDDDLARAFQHAFCFLFPSRIEGFGLPAIEAMIWKCPVIAADAPCLPEICGDAALYAGPDDQQGWLDAVAALATNPALYQRQIACGSRRAEQFSWRHVAEVYLQLMARLDGISVLPEVEPHFHDANTMQRFSRTPTAA
jgi:glycosyltransferase involved in cell wall biosynthesis